MIRAISTKIKSLPPWVFRTLLIIIGILIVIFNDAFGDEGTFAFFALLYFILLFVLLVKWVFSQIRSILALKRDKTKMEMLHLKSQVNPHFFFNTLNNLYGLVDKNPEEAQSLILKLSDLMRYSIYEGQHEWVNLQEEIDYLKNYVDIQKNRYNKNVTVNFNIDIDTKDYKIMPLLLILLVENAFKHGVEKLRNDAKVDIKLTAIDSRIKFMISNNYDIEEIEDHNPGIGLSNLKRRLEIGYKKEFELSISKNDETFQAQLSLYKV